ncbi:MAG: LD-carboxypeptidase [Cryomorphaceae bacterium]
MIQNNIPESLKPGDFITIVSTARAVDDSFINYATQLIESRGYRVKTGKNLFKVAHQFAGTDLERLDDLNDAIRDPDVKAIFCARGGYGTARLLDGMDLAALKNHPKWIVGYSDISALLNHIYQMEGIQGIHATMPVNYKSNTPESIGSLFEILEGVNQNYSFDYHDLNREGSATGEMVGGNLSVIYSLMGSKSQLDTAGKILFIEDLDEYLYHIDRMMIALKRAGMLHNLSGLIIGGMTDMNDNTTPFGKTAVEIIAEAVAEYEFPVCFGFPAGHIDDNRAWRHGQKIRLTASSGQPVSIAVIG